MEKTAAESVLLVALLIFLSVISGSIALNTNLYEVLTSSWTGVRSRQFSLRWMNQRGVSSLLECVAIAASSMAQDQLLVFIEPDGSSVLDPQCILANQTASSICRRMPTSSSLQSQPNCCTRVFAKSLVNCWTVLQHRVNNSTNFTRNWTEYLSEFGQGPFGNYWIGLRALNSLTQSSTKTLRCRMTTWDNVEHWADYSSFSVAAESEQFTLSVSGFKLTRGSIGDSMSEHNNMKFTTIDSDNDNNGILNCAVKYRGGWWYKSCHKTNPNGIYYNSPEALNTPVYADGIVWDAKYYYSMKEFEMLLL